MAFVIKQGDTRPMFVVALRDKYGTPQEEPLDLTGASSVLFLMRPKESVDVPTVSAAAEITDAAGGVVTYEWVAPDTDTVGEYEAEIQITWSDGGIETVPNEGFFYITITDDIGP